MVAPPDFFEVVTDVQLGFNVRLYGDIPPEDIGIMLKKGYQSREAYVELPKAKYTVVRDGRTYYIRVYDLDPDTWYDIRPYYRKGDKKYWYDSDDGDWSESEGDPVTMKTRNTLNEIEVRFAGKNAINISLKSGPMMMRAISPSNITRKVKRTMVIPLMTARASSSTSKD